MVLPLFCPLEFLGALKHPDAQTTPSSEIRIPGAHPSVGSFKTSPGDSSVRLRLFQTRDLDFLGLGLKAEIVGICDRDFFYRVNCYVLPNEAQSVGVILTFWKEQEDEEKTMLLFFSLALLGRIRRENEIPVQA